ncbi:MAG: BACON domain-containing carbohydrate-binding protein [Bryobacteraceae bacterium]
MRYIPTKMAGVFLILAACGVKAQNIVTFHNDNARTGQNLNETLLTTSNVNASQFGKLFTQPVDGQVYAQPLYLQNVRIPGQGLHNVVYVATEHDGLYAFDADTNQGQNSSPLWYRSFLDPAAGVTSYPSSDAFGCGQITPELGISGTPVIDTATNSLYVVVTTKEVSGSTTNYVHRLHAVDASTGNERPNSPVVVNASVTYSVGGASKTVTWLPHDYKQRVGLLLLNGTVYAGFGSHCDESTAGTPYHGWLIGFDETTLAQVSVWNATPNGSEGALWNSGVGPTADQSGNIYLMTGNGTFDASQGSVTSGYGDYGDSFVKLSTQSGLTVPANGSYTVSDAVNEAAHDLDLGSGGLMLLPSSVGSTQHPSLITGAGKEGRLYLLDTSNLGGYNSTNNDANAVQVLTGLGAVFSMPAYFNGNVYISASADYLRQYPISAGAYGSLGHENSTTFAYPGATPSISANGNSQGIVWLLESGNNLRAFDATSLTQLYSSGTMASRDSLGTYIKYSVPAIANGKVYAGTSNALVTYGLLTTNCTYTVTPGTTSFTSATTTGSISVQASSADCPWTGSSNSSWLQVTSGSSGSGSGSVSFTVEGNAGTARSANITVGGQTVAIMQGSSPDTVSPGGGSGSSQIFVFTFADSSGAGNIAVADVLINTYLNGRNACYVAYSQTANELYLVNDAGSGLLPGITLAGSSSTSNGQCTVSSSGSSAQASGNILTLTLNIAFTASFEGNHVFYLAQQDTGMANTGWHAMGDWTVPGASTPSLGPVSLSPNNGAGLNQVFTLTFTDTNGFADLTVMNMLINGALNGAHACYMAFSQQSNVLYLVNDSGSALTAPLTLGGQGFISNSQCSVNGPTSSVLRSGNTLTLTLDMTFTAGFAGTRVMYLAAGNAEGANSGWQPLGTWLVQ